MVVLRFLGGLLLVLAVMALVSDWTHYQSAAHKAPLLTPLVRHWTELSPTTLASTQRFIVRSVHPLLWDPVLRSIMAVPTCVLCGVVGGLLAWAGRRRRRVELFTN